MKILANLPQSDYPTSKQACMNDGATTAMVDTAAKQLELEAYITDVSQSHGMLSAPIQCLSISNGYERIHFACWHCIIACAVCQTGILVVCRA